jgi:hypothetical protein
MKITTALAGQTLRMLSVLIAPGSVCQLYWLDNKLCRLSSIVF